MAKDDGRTEEAIREYNLAIRNMPEVVPEGRLYPVLMRISLSELYKQAGNEAAAKQQLAAAEQMINNLQVEGPARAEFLRVRASIRGGFGDLASAEADLKEALKIDPNNQLVVLQYANLLWRTKRKEEARQLYANILERDPKNRFALESIGYLSRDMGDRKAAEMYFTRMAQAYPDDYVPHLAMGDMFTMAKQYDRALLAYEQAYKRNQKVAVIVANAANAAIEVRKFQVANEWIARATGSMLDDPRVMRERERALFHAGNFLESAQLGYKVLERLPDDRNASVYLAYALYNLGRYDEVLALSSRYEQILPKEPNFPMLAGHVHKQGQLLDESVEDYSRAILLDPKMVDAYVNRGYVLTDLQNAEAALQDFDGALKIQPKNGIAHLGRALAFLQRCRKDPGTVRRHPHGARHCVSPTALARQGGEGVPHRADLRARRFQAAHGPGQYALQSAPLQRVHPGAERGDAALAR
jgi:tetratricopeptide (TPR) repeat protein